MNKHNHISSKKWFTPKNFFIIIGFVAVSLCIYRAIQNKAAPAEIDLTPYLSDGKLKHLSIVMDGNRRWAKKQGFKPWIGHRQGVGPFKQTIQLCLKHGIPYLSFYTFSLENFKRPQEELSYLFSILAQELAHKERDELHKQGIKVRFIGDRSMFPEQLRAIIDDLETLTAHNTKMQLDLLFCYGGQQEIIAATKKMYADLLKNNQSPESITPELFNSYLWTGDAPPPDLIIRTGSEQPLKRMSNYYLYHCAYSELCFLSKYWPDVTHNDLAEVIIQFINSKRNFGA